MRDRDIYSGDIGNTHPDGERQRAVGYMAMPPLLQEYDESNRKLVIRLGSPMWGEAEAGYEWQCTFHNRLLKCSWQACEAVPVMYYFNAEGHDARLITNVDDFLLSCTRGSDIAEHTHRTLKEIFTDVKWVAEPTSFVGYNIVRDRSKHTLTINMVPQPSGDLGRGGPVGRSGGGPSWRLLRPVPLTSRDRVCPLHRWLL